MLPNDRLSHALSVHATSYRLLKWMGDAIGKGFIPVWRAHGYGSSVEGAAGWISANYHSLPADARPEPDQLQEFARFFSTYLITSFDVYEEPGARLISECGCRCELCVRLVAASNLQPKRLEKRDKARAEKLMTQRLMDLAAEHGVGLDSDQAEVLAARPEHRRNIAYSAYGDWLIRRLDGKSDGGSILVLWRLIAWKPTGSPIPGFKLHERDFIAAEAALLAAMPSAAN